MSGPYKVSVTIEKDEHGYYTCCPELEGCQTQGDSCIYESIQLKTILDRFGVHTAVNISKTRERAEELVNIGFGVADAAHIAFAEKSGTPFISCDDR